MRALVPALLWIAAAPLAGCAAGSATPGDRPELVAHRGGVVDERRPENSRAALEAAIERGYAFVETDVRESRDGRAVVHHDADFVDFYGDDRRVADLDWDEIAALRGSPGGERPLGFAELAALCAGRIGIMLDTKPPGHDDAFFRSLESALRENGLLESALVIGTPESRRWFRGRARVGVDRHALRAAAARGEDVGSLYFLFEHGRDLDAGAVREAQRLGVPVVPSVNLFHYDDLPDPVAPGRADLGRLRKLGVRIFQIDSVYDPELLE